MTYRRVFVLLILSGLSFLPGCGSEDSGKVEKSRPMAPAETMAKIIEAMKICDMDAIKAIFAKDIDVNSCDGRGRTALHYATYEPGCLEIAQFLLSIGAEVDVRDNRGQTPLMFAIAKLSDDIAKLLVNKGADVNAMDNYGLAPLTFAVSTDQEDMVEFLLDRGAKMPPSPFGRGLLHLAARFGNEEIAVMLLEKLEMNVNTLDSQGRTPIDLANPKGEVAKLLKSRGAKTGHQIRQEKLVVPSTTNNPNTRSIPSLKFKTEPKMSVTKMGPRFGKKQEISADGRHMAMIKKKDNGKKRVLLDGVEQGEFDAIIDFAFSPDGKSLAFAAEDGGKWFVIRDGKKGPYEQLGLFYSTQSNSSSMLFSPDGKRLAFIIIEKGLQSLILDGVTQGEYEEILWPTFSPDGKHFAFAAKHCGFMFVVRDGKAEGRYDTGKRTGVAGIRPIQFSPDGKHLAYWALKQSLIDKPSQWVGVVDGKEIKTYSAPGKIIFSPDGKRYGYVGNRAMVIDGKEFRHKRVRGESLIFSPDSKHVAYVAGEDSAGIKKWVVLDGKKGAEYVNVLEVTFSPDSSRLGYCGYDGDDWFMVVDQKKGKSYHRVNSLTFSPDSKHAAYIAQIFSEHERVVLDGREGADYFQIGGNVGWNDQNRLHFSPDSKRLAYVAREIRKKGAPYAKAMLVLDHVPGKKYAEVNPYSIVFSPDSKHIAYWAKDKKWVLVVDDKELGQFEYPAEQIIFWLNNTTLRAFGELEKDCVRIDVTLLNDKK